MAMATASFPPPSATAASATSSIVFEIGKFNAVLEKVESAGCCSSGRHLPAPPPKPLLIGRPSDAGEFPVLLLIHGYLLYNTFYSQLIHQIASHGFIVIAPQVLTFPLLPFFFLNYFLKLNFKFYFSNNYKLFSRVYLLS